LLASAYMSPTHPTFALHQLLDASLEFPPEYAGGFSNHLSMALTALQGIGADNQQMAEFMAAYLRRFAAPPLKSAPRIAADWTTLCGKAEAFDVLRCTFASFLKIHGRDSVLREALPLLITGVGASAFHGAIRVAYAVEASHLGELAAALAYWASRWTLLARPRAVATDLDTVADWLQAIDLGLHGIESDQGSRPLSIDARMNDAAQSAAYSLNAGRLRVIGRDTEVLLSELALAGATRYAATGDFTILHIATAARALRVLLPWLPKQIGALDPLWHAVAAASIAADSAFASSRAKATGKVVSWDEVLIVARASYDEHVIKLVHAMAAQHAAVPDPTWLLAAAAAIETS
jgi:hypothetical protein